MDLPVAGTRRLRSKSRNLLAMLPTVGFLAQCLHGALDKCTFALKRSAQKNQNAAITTREKKTGKKLSARGLSSSNHRQVAA